MSTHEFFIIGIAVVLPLITFTICFVYLIQTINRLENFIMAQKDLTAFTHAIPIVKNKINKDIKTEKETKDYLDYMKVVNSGIGDDKDIKRFGTLTVDQG